MVPLGPIGDANAVDDHPRNHRKPPAGFPHAVTTAKGSQMSGSSRTRSKQLARRPLILPHEVLRMRGDEQIVFTAGNAPLRCGRAIWFRRDEMKACVGENRFYRNVEP